jgi:hypothetical protein
MVREGARVAFETQYINGIFQPEIKRGNSRREFGRVWGAPEKKKTHKLFIC